MTRCISRLCATCPFVFTRAQWRILSSAISSLYFRQMHRNALFRAFSRTPKSTERNAESERTKPTAMRIQKPLAKFPQRFTCNLNLKFATFSFGAARCVCVCVCCGHYSCAQLTRNRIHQQRPRTKRDGPKTIKSELINLLNRITDVNEIQFAEALPNASYFAHLNPSWISIS